MKEIRKILSFLINREKIFLALAGVFIIIWLFVMFAPLRVMSNPTEFPEAPVRIHVIANSDNEADQILKLAVRDMVIEVLTPLLANVEDSNEARKIVEVARPQLEEVASKMCKIYGYGAKSEFGTFDFPERIYGDKVFPSGKYEALRIILGEGVGHNWWCVLFPPLCFVDEIGKTLDMGVIDEYGEHSLEVMNNINSSSPKENVLNIRLKFLDLFKKYFTD